MQFWSEKSPGDSHREAQARLKRIAQESAKQDESQIFTWLDLAKKLFDKDDDPTPSAA
jgi:hypothetical protein